jgi:putative redox protein
MQAKVTQVKGITFIGKGASDHWVSMDGPEEFGGSNSAARPKELLLIGLGGCTGSDVASILNKMKENFSRFEIDIDAETATEHPKVYTNVHLKYKFWGEDLKQENIEKAIKLSQEKYCSVTAMLQKAIDITYSFELNPQE